MVQLAKDDQVRFELGYAYFGGKKIKIIAPWREWNLQSRADLIKYAKKNKISIPKDKKGAPPFQLMIIYFTLRPKVKFWKILIIRHQSLYFKELYHLKKHQTKN